MKRGPDTRPALPFDRGPRAVAPLGAGLLAALLTATPASAQEQRVSVPTEAMDPPSTVEPAPEYVSPTISLAEAVRLTLEYDPRIQLEKQEVARALGTHQQARGAFDARFQIAPQYSYSTNELLPFFVGRETLKREFLKVIAEQFAFLSVALRESLAEFEQDGTVSLPPCPDGLDNVVIDLGGGGLINARSLSARTGFDALNAFRGSTNLGPRSDLDDFGAVCIPNNRFGAPPITSVTVVQRVNDILSLELDTFIAGAPELARDILTATTEIAEAVAAKSQLALDRIGGMPESQVAQNLQFQFGYLKPFRSGLDLSISLTLQSSQNNFIGKSLDPAFGGLGFQGSFPSSFSVSLDVPLGKGRGRVSAGAPERAAEQGINASRDRLRHSQSEEVFSTVIAYLNLIGAQVSLNYLDESVARQLQLVEATQQLIQRGDVAQAELDRVLARAATVEGAAADQRLAVLNARFVLADAIGLEVEAGNAPRADEGFSETLDYAVGRDSALERATSQRRDLRAAAHLVEAADILTRASRADLKPRTDLFISGGLSTLYESPIFKVFPEELDEPRTESFVDYYSPRGLARSFAGSWDPFVVVGVTFEIPFGNNSARGRLRRDQASLRSNQIRESDLERVIEGSVVSLTVALQRARESVFRHRESIGFLEQTLQSTLAQYEAGDVSLIDTLTTEEELTNEQIQVSLATQIYLSLVTRLKFELGDLVEFNEQNTARETTDFEATDFVSRE